MFQDRVINKIYEMHCPKPLFNQYFHQQQKIILQDNKLNFIFLIYILSKTTDLSLHTPTGVTIASLMYILLKRWRNDPCYSPLSFTQKRVISTYIGICPNFQMIESLVFKGLIPLDWVCIEYIIYLHAYIIRSTG